MFTIIGILYYQFITVIVLGLYNAGKSTMMQKLKHGEVTTSCASIGNVYHFGNISISDSAFFSHVSPKAIFLFGLKVGSLFTKHLPDF